MADHSKPTVTSAYANYTAEIDARFDDLSIGMDPAFTTVTEAPTNTIRWTSAGKKWQKWSGTAWGDLADKFAISISGNADTATRANTADVTADNSSATAFYPAFVSAAGNGATLKSSLNFAYVPSTGRLSVPILQGNRVDVLANNPYIVIQDSDGDATNCTGYIAFRDMNSVERAYAGFGSAGNRNWTVYNGVGDIEFKGVGKIKTELKHQFSGADTARALETTNASASNETQFYVEHSGSVTKIGNARGALKLVAGSAEVVGDTSGDWFARYLNMSHAPESRSADTVFYSSTDNYVRKNDAAGMRASLNIETAMQHGQCRLAKSGANLLLSRYGGNRLRINGVTQTIPAAGVSLAPTGLTASTTYYIYAYMNGTTMTLEASTTGYGAHPDHGYAVKSNDFTRTLVGMARTNASTAWEDSNAARYVLSYYNRRSIKGFVGLTADRSISSTTFIEVHSEIRAQFLSWGDEAVICSTCGGWWNSPGNTQFAAIGIDGATTRSGNIMMDPSSNEIMPLSCSTEFEVADGYHYLTLAGRVTGGTGSFIGAGDGACYLFFTVRG